MSNRSSNIYNGPIVDPHHHFFALNDLSYWWLSGPKQIASHPFLHEKLNDIRKPYYLEDLLADSAKHNVVKFVHIQCECDDNIAEAKFLESLAAKHPQVAGIVPYANLANPDIEPELASLAALPHVRGIRMLLNYHPTRTDLRDTPIEYALDPQWQKGYALLHKYNLHYEFHGFAQQLQSAVNLAKLYPDIPMVINHSGLLIDFNDEGYDIWHKGISSLSELSNVSIKVSGLGMIRHDFTTEMIRPMVEYIISKFTTSRVMFASNFPVDKAVSTYDYLYSAFKEIASKYTQEEQKAMFHDNAIKFYRLK